MDKPMKDTLNDADKLLICAKVAGRRHSRVEGDRIFVLFEDSEYWTVYDPRTNDAQNRELELILIDDGYHVWRQWEMYYCDKNIGDGIGYPTLNEAIINAIVAREQGNE